MIHTSNENATTAVALETVTRQVKCAKLEIRNRPLRGQSYELERSATNWVEAGRDADAALHIPHSTVSGRHFRVMLRGHRVALQPLETANGTFLGSVFGQIRLSPHSEVLLDQQSIFWAGHVRFRLTWESYEDVVLSNESRMGTRLIGGSESMLQLYAHLRQVVKSETAVLVLGESGTGKSEVAALIHEFSFRRANPFVRVNCREANMNETKAETALFGTNKHGGQIEQAQGGVVYVDGVDELPQHLQRRFVHLVDHGSVERGGVEYPVNVRLIFSSRNNPRHAVDNGSLLADLRRCFDVVVEIPPLRDHLEDVELLTQSFVSQVSSELGRPVSIAEDGIRFLERLRWDGNVAELQQLIQGAIIASDAESLSAEWLSRYMVSPTFQNNDLRLKVVSGAFNLMDAFKLVGDDFLRDCLQYALLRTRNNISAAARLVQCPESTFRYHMNRVMPASH